MTFVGVLPLKLALARLGLPLEHVIAGGLIFWPSFTLLEAHAAVGVALGMVMEPQLYGKPVFTGLVPHKTEYKRIFLVPELQKLWGSLDDFQLPKSAQLPLLLGSC